MRIHIKEILIQKAILNLLKNCKTEQRFDADFYSNKSLLYIPKDKKQNLVGIKHLKEFKEYVDKFIKSPDGNLLRNFIISLLNNFKKQIEKRKILKHF